MQMMRLIQVGLAGASALVPIKALAHGGSVPHWHITSTELNFAAHGGFFYLLAMTVLILAVSALGYTIVRRHK